MALSNDEKRARFEASLRYGGGTHTLDDIVALVRADKARFWDHGDGTILTELLQYPQFKACQYWVISGALPDCLALDAEISDYARGEGCRVATAAGRRGWGRVAAPYGWRPHMFTFIKEL